MNFQRIANKVFAKLLESFPNPVDLNATVADIEAKAGYRQKEVTSSPWGESEYIYPEADEVLFANTMRWLDCEGYIRFEKQSDYEFLSVVLSEKGLKTLGALPPCLAD